MAVYFTTAAPQDLLEQLRLLVDQGRIKTWSYDADGDFTHTAEQWRNKAWLRPSVGPGQLAFYILAPLQKGMTRAVYGVYHGRFIEAALNHADTMFVSAWASAFAQENDNVLGE